MKNYLFLLSICTLSFFFVGCKETGASTDKKSAPKENPRGKKFLVKAKQYSQEDFLAHKSADKAAKGNASGDLLPPVWAAGPQRTGVSSAGTGGGDVGTPRQSGDNQFVQEKVFGFGKSN